MNKLNDYTFYFDGGVLEVERIEGNTIYLKEKEDIELVILNQYSFDDFWDFYDKKVGKKSKLEKKYNKLSKKTREKIFYHVGKYKESEPRKQYRKNPETYLNNESWNDEIIYSKPKEVNVVDKLTEFING